jgi:tripartite-type tricarboxylate transporter receptor subunit TctC
MHHATLAPVGARLVAAVAAAGALVATTITTVTAQDYPTRPIEIIVTWGPGGGADQTGRMIGKLLEPALKVSLPVENVAGSSGVTGLNKLLNGNPEGYQLGLVTADTLSLLAAPRAQRWTLDNLATVAVLIKQPSGFFVQEGGAFKTWADVEAKAKTTELKVGVTGLGTPDELAIEQLKKHRGLKLIAVPFAKPAERYASVLGGHADLVYEQAGDVRSFIDNKQLRPVMFLSNEKVHPFTDIPISKELGMNLVLDQYRTLMAKAGTPLERMKLLREETAKAGGSAEFKKFLEEAWADPNSVIVGDAATAYIAEQIKTLKSIWQ